MIYFYSKWCTLKDKILDFVSYLSSSICAKELTGHRALGRIHFYSNWCKLEDKILALMSSLSTSFMLRNGTWAGKFLS